MIQGQHIIFDGCGGTSTLVRGKTLAARWFREPQPISNQPVGLGSSHRVERYGSRVSPFSSPGCWSL